MPAGLSVSDFYSILPELVLTGGALIVLIVDVLLPRGSNRALAAVTLLAIAATLASLAPFLGTQVEVAHGLLAVDRFAVFLRREFFSRAITVLMGRYLEIERVSVERYFLIRVPLTA
jgi:NADH:ubiquinone oxidoreductase subunit 2 (subunit N)